MAKDKHDNKTLDVLTLRRGVKGRPITGTALTNAEKQSTYRAKKKLEQLVSLTVMIPATEKAIVDQWVKNSGGTMSDVIATMIRLVVIDQNRVNQAVTLNLCSNFYSNMTDDNTNNPALAVPTDQD
jgi:hypothetical protein